MTAAPVDFEAKAPTRVPLLTALFSRRTWLEFSYLWLTLLLSPFALAYVIGFLTLSVSLVWTVVGLYVGGVVLLGARGWGSMYRGMARTILGTHVAAPARFVWPKGFWRKLGALFVDGDAWRALLFTFLTFPLSLLSTIVTTTGSVGIRSRAWRAMISASGNRFSSISVLNCSTISASLFWISMVRS